MDQVIKDVKLRRTNHGLYIHFELNDGTEIMRSEERLLKNLGYNPDPWDHLVLTAELLERYMQSIGNNDIFHWYLALQAHNCGVNKTLIKKNGDVILLGDSAVLAGFKRYQIEARVKDR